MIIKSSKLNRNLIDHGPYFYENYVRKFYHDPAYLIKNQKNAKDYASKQIEEVYEEFMARYKITKGRMVDVYESKKHMLTPSY